MDGSGTEAAQCDFFAGFMAYFRDHGRRYARFRPAGPLSCRDRYALLCMTEETSWPLSVGPQPGRIGSPQPRRGWRRDAPRDLAASAGAAMGGRGGRLPRDLTALVEAGLIVAVGDGPQIRYAVAESDEEGR